MNTIELMHGQMVEYFTCEKYESVLFILAGVAAIALSVVVFLKFRSYRGMIIPLAAVAVIQIAVGSAVYFRTGGQIADFGEKIAADVRGYKASELARMDTVMKNFRIYKFIEIALLAAGIVLTFLFRESDFIYSLGIGLIIQPAFMLTLDLIAERRGEAYIRAIMELI